MVNYAVKDFRKAVLAEEILALGLKEKLRKMKPEEVDADFCILVADVMNEAKYRTKFAQEALEKEEVLANEI